jgi:hypothetical protein
MLGFIRKTILNTTEESRLRLPFRLLTALFFFIYTADTLNLNVLYAAVVGQIEFVDNPDVEDSLFDISTPTASPATFITYTSSKIPVSDVTIAKTSANFRTRVYEDIDAVGIDDAHTSADFVVALLPYPPNTSEYAHTTDLIIDRIIAFRQLLI